MNQEETLTDIPEFIKKHPVLVAGASFWISGLGQILCGRIRRGIMFIVPNFILTLFIYFRYWTLPSSNPIWSLFYPVQLIIQFVIRVWSTYDAYNLGKKLSEI